MATRLPVPTAPELPATETAATSGGNVPSHWEQFSDASSNNSNSNMEGEMSREMPQPSAPEAVEIIDSLSAPKSSTTYSFAGSALGHDSVTATNLNENLLKKDSKKENPANKTKDQGEEKSDESFFECNICLDTAKDAVVSMCGHLFCWPCLHQWLETRPNRKLCPVCKSAIDRDKVVPLYGRNSTKQEDPRNKVPPRPAGHRTEPEPQQGFQGLGFGDGFHMSFGIGAFPFGYFASSFNIGDPRPAAANRGTTQYEDEQQLSKLFLYLALLCIAWLLFA